MTTVKFYNISNTTRMGIKPNSFIVLEKEKAFKLAKTMKSQMGSRFLIIPGNEVLDKPLKIVETWQTKPSKKR